MATLVISGAKPSLVLLMIRKILFFSLLVLKGFEAASSIPTFSGSKRGRIYDIEDGEINESVFNPRKLLTKPFEFRFPIDSTYVEQSPEEALKIFYRFDKERIDELLNYNFDLHATGIWDRLMEMKNYGAIKYLLTNQFNDKAVHKSVFEESIKTGSTALALFLLKISKETLIADGAKALLNAIKNRRYKILKALRKERFDVNVMVSRHARKYPLHLAVIMDDLQLVKILLKFHSVNVNICDIKGNTPLHYCKSAEMARLLIQNGADLEKKNLTEELAVNVAARDGFYEVVAFLEPELLARFSHFIVANQVNHFVPVSRNFLISRRLILEDFYYLASCEPDWYRKDSKFTIKFVGESGVDQGGVMRESMSLLIERFFLPVLLEDDTVADNTAGTVAETDINQQQNDSPDNDAQVRSGHSDSADERVQSILDFMSSDEDEIPAQRLYHAYVAHLNLAIVPSWRASVIYNGTPFECVDLDNKLYKISSTFDGPEEVYKFIGSIVAKTMLMKIPLKVKLVPSLLKLAMNRELSFEDLQQDDPVIYKSLQEFLSPNFNFDAFQYEMPISEGIPVTSKNIRQFLDETALDVMYLRQKTKIDLFVEGIQSVLPANSIQGYFSAQELQEILCGSNTIDREDLPKAILIVGALWKLKEGMFWDALAMLSDEELIQLIRFITGVNGLPFGGIKNLSKSIKVYDGYADQLFPRASTCAYTLNLPVGYETPEEVLEALRLAMSSTQEFVDGYCGCFI